MKKILILISSLFCTGYLLAQNQEVEKEIKRLEQLEVQAVLTKDTITLKKLWDKNYVVQNPANKIILARENTVDRPVLNAQRTSFTREVEQITINGDIAVSMGNETVVPSGDLSQSGKTIKRRYTNVWMKAAGEWKLVARHANVICQ